jgi:hypothetical protein
MIIPYGIHDVHGTTNWLRLQPTLIPWIPHGIPDGFHGFHMDSIWINPGKVKTSYFAMWVGAWPLAPNKRRALSEELYKPCMFAIGQSN